jgi:hypothetical protein
MGTSVNPLPCSKSSGRAEASDCYAVEIQSPLPFPLLVIMATVVWIIKSFRRHTPV